MTDPTGFNDLRLLLPFYINGTLDSVRRTELDAALAASSELRAELAAVQAVQQQVRQSPAAALPGSADETEARLSRLMDRLPAQLPAQPPAQPPTARAASGRLDLSAALAFLTPRRWVPAVALSLAAIIGFQAAALSRAHARNDQLGTQLAQITQKYQSASGPCQDQAGSGRIAVELADGAAWAQIAALLDTEQLTIADSGGFGTLTLASKLKDQALSDQIARLGKSALVTSAAVAR